MGHSYSEGKLVERPAIALFAELGWQTVSALEEVLGEHGTLGRQTKSEVVLLPRLRNALCRLNPGLPDAVIDDAVERLIRDRSAMSLQAANREVYLLLKDGIPLSIPEPSSGGQRAERLRVIDWEEPTRNDFVLVSQLKVAGSLYNCIPDLVGFVNGLPFVVIELKKPGVPARAAFDENLTHYKAQIPALFWYNALLIASNGTESRVGSLTADWERFFEWKRIESEDEPRRVSLDVMLRGTCDKARLLDLTENFTLFSEHKEGLTKILGQNHQFLGVNNAIVSMRKAQQAGHGRAGVFWQTQGSGKSFSMVFFAQKVLRKIPGNWSFVIVTDRVELDDQIAHTFKAVGAVTQAEGDECHATSGAHLQTLLRGNHRYVFTLIHKFQSKELLCDRPDVIVINDEAHRSQYDTLAMNMRSALPKALFLAFTGTPLIAGEERTREVFGDYVSIYDFQQSVEDRATVPLFYENRTPELQLVNPTLNEDIYALIEEAELAPEQQARLELELGRQYHILTRDDRLDTVAHDIVQHFLGRGFLGKAMVVSIDKATALRMHDKVRRYWAEESAQVERELLRKDLLPARKAELQQRLSVLQTTDMALIVSPEQNEIASMKKLGLSIESHRQRMNEEALDQKFKDTKDPLRLVFVCAMWLTGFDAPSCSTVYLDKPMRNHTLMQTIARANRVFPGKHSGVIVDYANVFASLEKALALYGAAKGGQRPVHDKKELADDLRAAVQAALTFLHEHKVSIHDIETETVGSMRRLQLVADAVNALISPDPVRREFLGHERLVSTLYAAVKPNPAALEFASVAACLSALAADIRQRLHPKAEIAQVMGAIGELLDESIVGVEMPDKPVPVMDLSQIDFDALRSRFQKSKQKNIDVEVLKASIAAQLERMVRLNKTRADFQQKFEELIDSYNSGSRNLESLFAELVEFTRSLSEEQRRHVREQLSEEEQTVFDILTKPAPELSTAERNEVKKVARELLTKIKEQLVLNWRQKNSTRSRIQLVIEDILDQGLPRAYTTELYKQKCLALFEHLYENYPERNQSVYEGVG